MLRRLFSSLTDEFAGLSLLYGVMRHGNRPAAAGAGVGRRRPAIYSPATRPGCSAATPAAVDLRAAAVPHGRWEGSEERPAAWRGAKR